MEAKRLSAVLLFLSLAAACMAGDGSENCIYDGKLKDGASTYAFWTMQVYREPRIRSGIIAELKQGTQVTVGDADGYFAEHTGEKDYLVSNGYREDWHAITWNDADGKPRSGYAWGGDLAKAWVKYDLDNDGETELAMMNVIKFIQNKQGLLDDKMARVRVLKDGNTQAGIDFMTVESTAFSKNARVFGYQTWMDVVKKDGFDPPVIFIRTHFSYGACDYLEGEVYAAFYGGKFAGSFTSSVTNSEDYEVNVDDRIVFPGDKGGKKNRISVVKLLTYKDTGKLKYKDAVEYIWKEGNIQKLGTKDVDVQ